MTDQVVYCYPHETGPLREQRPAVVEWLDYLGSTPLCAECLDAWRRFGIRPLDVVSLLDHCVDCGHLRQTHGNYRPGTDCGMCSCPRFALRRPVTDRLRSFVEHTLASLVGYGTRS